MHKYAVALVACVAAVAALASQGPSPSPVPPHGTKALGTPPEEQEASGSERLAVVSQSGWRPITVTGTSLAGPRTPSYAAPLSPADFRPNEVAAVRDREPSDGRRGREAERDGPPTRASRHQPPRDAVVDGPTAVRLPLPPPLPPPGRSWGGGPRIAPIVEPDSEVEALGYRYLPPPGFAPGPSATTPFWEASWLRRRDHLLQELGLQGPCRCAPPGDGYYPGYSPAAVGYLARYRYGGVLDPDLPYRLGVGAYALYGGGRPLHYHNTGPLGAARLHDNPN